MSQVVVVNYGMGNLMSVSRGLEKVGAKVIFSDDPNIIRQADRVILPGVGAFEVGMKELCQRELDHALHDFIKTERPLLGICLGMQMLLDQSEEHGEHKGLGFISGKVVQIPQVDKGEVKRKTPHIGWNALQLPNQHINWGTSILENSNIGDFLYFVHSFMAVPEKKEYILAQCEYEGLAIPATLNKDNITGCQFHPEKSGEAGLKVLYRFLTL